jgi:hypothetical protein
MSKAAAGASGGTETVKVMVRARPMNSKEKARGKFLSTLIMALIFDCQESFIPSQIHMIFFYRHRCLYTY